MTRAEGTRFCKSVTIGFPRHAHDKTGPSWSKATAQREADARTNQTGVDESFGASTAESFFFGV
jgi:hypothetical protein